MFEVTVVIPAKNRAHTLPLCIDSILAQTFPVAEIIVVDDESNDNTKDVVRAYADRNVRYVLLPIGKGAQTARNYGVQIAKSDWIAFQDSDDLWLPEKMMVEHAELAECGYDEAVVVHSSGLMYTPETNSKKIIEMNIAEGDCYKQLLLRSGPMFQGMLVSKKALKKIGGLDENCPSYQEWDTAIRLSKYCKFVHVKQPLFEWVWHAGEAISKDTRRDVVGYQYVMDKNRSAITLCHGLVAWRTIKLQNIMRAIDFGLWDLAYEISNREHDGIVFVLAGLLARLKCKPRGAGRVLKLLARLKI